MIRESKPSRFPLTYQDMWDGLRKELAKDREDAKDRAMTAAHTTDELAFQQGRFRQSLDTDAAMTQLEKDQRRRLNPDDDLSEESDAA